MVHETAFSMPAAVRKSLAATMFERNTMLKTLKRKIALVAVAGLGFGLVSTVPAFAVKYTKLSLGAVTATGGSANTGAVAATLVSIPLSQDASGNAGVFIKITQANSGPGSINGLVVKAGDVTLTTTQVDGTTGDATLEKNTSVYADLTAVDNAKTPLTIAGVAPVAGTYTLSVTVGTLAAAAFTAAVAAGTQVVTRTGIAVDVSTVKPTAIAATALPENAKTGMRLSITNTGVFETNTANAVTHGGWTVRFGSVPAGSGVANIAVGDALTTYQDAQIATGTATTVSFVPGGSAGNQTQYAGANKTFIAGTYTGNVIADVNANGAIDAGDAYTAFSVTLGGTPVSMSLVSAAQTAAGAAATAHKVILKDTANNVTRLASGDTISMAATVNSGGGTFTYNTNSGANITPANSATGPATIAWDAANQGTDGSYAITNTLSAAGTATLAFNFAGNLSPLATAVSGTLTSVTTANATGIKLTTANTTSNNTTYTAPAAVTTNTTTAYFAPQTTASFSFTITGTAGDVVPVTVANNTNTPVTATSTSVTIGADGTVAFAVAVTATSTPAANDKFTVTVPIAAGTAGASVEFKAAAIATDGATLDPAASTSVLALVGSTNSFKATVVDQFNRAAAGYYVQLVTSAGSRNASKTITALTGVDGVATLALTDASTSTTLLTDSVSLNIFAPTDLTTDKSTATYTVTYGTGTAYGLTLSGGSTATTTWYAEVPVAEAVTATAGAGAATAANPDNGSSVAITPAMTSDANGTALAGVPIVYTISDGGKLATAATGNLATVWKDTVTANSNTAVFAIGTKPGVVTVTAKGGGLTATRSFTVIAPDANRARSITIAAPATNTAGSAAAYTATVKDGFGNVVPGVNVVFTMSGVGSFLNGSNTVTGTTDSTGVAMASVLSALAGDTTVTATITDTGAVAYEANNAGNKVANLPVVSFIAAVGSASVKGTVAPAAAAANPALDTVKADVKAVSDTVATLSKAVTTVQSSVTELTSSFSAQIKSLSAAIAKISKAIAALSKKIK